MAMPWSQGTSETPNKREFGDGDSLKMIPLWSIILAVLVFAGCQYFFDSAPPPHRRPGTLPMHLIFGYTTGTTLAGFVLLIGYVSRDVKRRNMPAALWMLIVVIMPGGIGAVVYFLLRQPILARCPVCGQCFRGVQITDVFCTQCGHDLAQDHAPARLRAYSDS
jgi:hypothetical protein